MKNIEINHISKSFGHKRVLEDISLTLPYGRCTGLCAPTGRGKSTLVSILLGLLPMDSGSLSGLEGQRIGAVFQETRLVENNSLFKNLQILGAPPEEIHHWLKNVGLDHLANQPVSSLSGGMKRKLSIARSLLYKPTILLLDEPFTGLDETTKEDMMALILKNCVTILLISHHKDELNAFADAIITL